MSEGLAVCVEVEFSKTQGKRTFFLETILNYREEENRELYWKLSPRFNDHRYDYRSIFFGGEEWPRWAGYSVGYYIVQKYLEKTHKTVFEVVDVNYSEVRKLVETI